MTHIKYTYTRPAHCEILISLGEKHPRFPPPPFFPSLATRIKFCKLQQGLNNNRNLSNKIAIPPEEIIISTSAPRISRFGRRKENARAPPSRRVLVLFEREREEVFARKLFSVIFLLYIIRVREITDSYGDGEGGGGEIEGFRIVPTFWGIAYSWFSASTTM